jgi:hypothetical protein
MFEKYRLSTEYPRKIDQTCVNIDLTFDMVIDLDIEFQGHTISGLPNIISCIIIIIIIIDLGNRKVKIAHLYREICPKF